MEQLSSHICGWLDTAWSVTGKNKFILYTKQAINEIDYAIINYSIEISIYIYIYILGPHIYIYIYKVLRMLVGQKSIKDL